MCSNIRNEKMKNNQRKWRENCDCIKKQEDKVEDNQEYKNIK